MTDKEGNNKELQERYRRQHERFFGELVEQVDQQTEGKALARDVNEYMAVRRGTIGAYPAIALTEYGQGIKLPEEIFNHPSLQECMVVSADLVLLYVPQ